MNTVTIDKLIFNQMMVIVKLRNKKLHAQIEDILSNNETLFTEHQAMLSINEARAIRTLRIKTTIKDAIKSLISDGIKPSKSMIHKSTNISYPTLKRHYDEILKEVQNER